MKTLTLLLTAAAACCYSASAYAADQAAAPDPAQVDSSDRNSTGAAGRRSAPVRQWQDQVGIY